MSLLFGAHQKVKPQFTGLSAQTSTSAIAIAIGFGRNRTSPNILWQGDFQSHKHKQKAGKGGPSQVTYTYTGSYILALGHGVVTAVPTVWKDQSKSSSYTALGFSLFSGAIPQTPWGYLTSAHPTEAIGYPGVAYLAVANYDLGQGNSLPQHSFEIDWPLVSTQVGGTGGDADPAQVWEAYLTNSAYGVGFDFSVFDQDSVFSTGAAPTTGDDAYQTYCRAMSFGISPVLISQEAARDTIERWARITNTAIVWNGYQLKLVPYGTDTVTGNGVTYLPNFPTRYTLSDSDFLGDKEDPITFDRKDPADCKNILTLTIANRDNEYNDLPIPWKDQGLIDQYGERKGDPMDAKEICEVAMGTTVVALIGQRGAYIRNTFTWKSGPQYGLLEPMDIVDLVDPVLGTLSVQITDIEEDDDDTLTFTADEFNGAVTSAAATSTQGMTNSPIDSGADPGAVNTPIIFEAPRSLTAAGGTTPEVWIAASGGDDTNYTPEWGGAYVWLSTDNVTYNQVGTIDTPARMGKLTAALALYGGANPDTVHTLSANLAMSGGTLEDATAADAAAYYTLSWVNGEFLSYQDATPTTTYGFDLTTLYRGLYGSTAGAHIIGDKFVRLDEAIFKYPIPAAYIGQVIYIKLQSYNHFGVAAQDLSVCTAYTFTPSGASYGTGTAGKPATPTGFTGSAGGGYASLTWAANVANDSIASYDVYRATGPSGSFGSATKIASVSSAQLTYTDNTGVRGSTYTYFLVATNAAGSSGNTAGVDLTVAKTGTFAYVVPFGFFTNTLVTEFLFGHTFTEPVTFPANWSGARGSVETNPAGSFVITLKKNGSTCGTITVSTGGVFTFATSGGTTVSFVAGDKLTGFGPAVADASIADLLASLTGTRS